MYGTAVIETQSKNLKEQKDGSMAGLGRRKGKGKMM